MLRKLSKAPLILGLVIALCSAEVVGQWSDANTLFRYGVEAFENGQLEDARLYFEHASRQGLQTSSLAYNLGVVYYRLGQYPLAREQFLRLLASRHEALARYNLGLIALKQGESVEAEAAFQAVLALAPPDNLRLLAERQLIRLDQRSPAPESDTTKSWYGFASVGGGYESNLALFPDSASSDLGDVFAEGVLGGSGYVYGDRDAGVRTDASLYARHYSSEDGFDSELVQADASWVQAVADGRARIGIGGAWVRRGGDPQERHTRGVLDYRWGDCLGLIAAGQCLLRATITQVDAEPEYAAYDGELYQLDGRYGTRWGAWQGQLRYRGEYNDREDFRTASEFYSVSPQRHGVRLQASHQLWPSLELELGAGVRYSYYPDRYQLDGAAGPVSVRREDTRLQAGLGLTWRLLANLAATMDYDYKKNRSTIDRYQYTNQYVALGVETSF